jgi:hypothetical protein
MKNKFLILSFLSLCSMFVGLVGLIVSANYSSHNWCLNFVYISTISSFLGIVFLMLDKQK